MHIHLSWRAVLGFLFAAGVLVAVVLLGWDDASRRVGSAPEPARARWKQPEHSR